jgi:hypothetical protein
LEPAAAKAGTTAICPKCNTRLAVSGDGPVQCPACRWVGEVYFFTALPFTVDQSQQALPDDATCLHHPNKRATAVCAGTGDYICALCAIELNGQVYSAHYLSTTGKKKVGKAFDRYLARPDSTIILCIVLCFIPPVNYIMIPTCFIWVPYCFYLYVKALNLRRSDPLFARVMGPSRVIAIPIILGLLSVGILIALISIAVAIVGSK